MQRAYPLAGVTVVDLGQIYNGPYCTFLMAMAGARIIKIEARGGENLRRRGVVGGAALPFAMLNSNKTFATLDRKAERGKVLPCAPVRKLDKVVNDRHMHERSALEWVEHPMYGRVSMYGRVCLPNSPLRFDGVEPMQIRPSGALGCDNLEFYGDWLGLCKTDIETLAREEVI